MAKTPEWQEIETGVPAREVRAPTREWGAPLDTRFYFPGYAEGSMSAEAERWSSPGGRPR